VLDIAEARELAAKAGNPRLKLAVGALDAAALDMLRELVGVPGMPDVSDMVARVIAKGGWDTSSLRLLGRDLKEL
jgi:hypothetical protein